MAPSAGTACETSPRHTRRRYGRRFSPELNILHRPDTVAERKQFGHWECDLIQFRKKFGKANVISRGQPLVPNAYGTRANATCRLALHAQAAVQCETAAIPRQQAVEDFEQRVDNGLAQRIRGFGDHCCCATRAPGCCPVRRRWRWRVRWPIGRNPPWTRWMSFP